MFRRCKKKIIIIIRMNQRLVYWFVLYVIVPCYYNVVKNKNDNKKDDWEREHGNSKCTWSWNKKLL